MTEKRLYFTYILASRIGGTLYVGITSDLLRRVQLHKQGEGSKFTARYGVDKLVWYETHKDVVRAIAREKRLKKWPRAWKVSLIEEHNPDWLDLFPAIASA